VSNVTFQTRIMFRTRFDDPSKQNVSEHIVTALEVALLTAVHHRVHKSTQQTDPILKPDESRPHLHTLVS
jgi:hypothetical protein